MSDFNVTINESKMNVQIIDDSNTIVISNPVNNNSIVIMSDGIQGPQGEAGPRGLDGIVQFRYGAGAPSNGLGNDGDQYHDTNNADIYTKVSGSWVLKDNINGPNVVTTSTTTNINGIIKGNGSIISQAVADTDYLTPSTASTTYEPKNSNIQSHIANTSNPHSVTKAQIGLGNVDNTSDINKPVSTAQQSALDLKENLTNKATDLTTLNNTLYPTTQAVYNAIQTTILQGSTFVFSGTNSDIAGYESMPILSVYSAGSLATVSNTVTTTPTLLEEFATNLGYPNITVLPSGLLTCHFETQKSAGSNNYYCHFELYKRSSGGTETLLVTSDNSSQSSVNTIVQQTVTGFVPSNITFLTTDRLVVKIYATMLSSSATITLRYDDTTNARLNLPSSPIGYVPENVANKSIDGTMSDYSQTLYPSQSAVVDYAMPLSYLDTDPTFSADSNSKVPSQQAVRVFSETRSNPAGGLTNQVLVKKSNTDWDYEWRNQDGGGVSAHGDLTGLGADDHTQYHNDSRADTWLGTKDTDSLAEGITNLYFTDARAQSAVVVQTIRSGFTSTAPSEDIVEIALSTKEDSIASGTTSQYWRGDKTFQDLDKTAVGLSNVDNTSDATKNSATATLTNKTISGIDNTITDIGDSSLVSGINANKISSGNVSNTEFDYLNGVTSAIQTQIDSKLNLSGGTMTGFLTLNADPTSTFHAVTKGYADSLANGLKWVDPVACATTANITLSGEQTIDGVTTNSSRVLVKNQSTTSQNGIYISSSGSWTRATDYDATSEVDTSAVAVDGGGQAGKAFRQTYVNPVVGTDPITFVNFLNTTYLASGNGIELSGSTFSLELDGSTLSTSTSGLKVASGGITNTEINASAGIAMSKLATMTASKILRTNASGIIEPTSINESFLDATSSIQTQLNSKLSAVGFVDNAVIRANGTTAVQVASNGLTLDDNNLFSVTSGDLGFDLNGGTFYLTDTTAYQTINKNITVNTFYEMNHFESQFIPTGTITGSGGIGIRSDLIISPNQESYNITGALGGGFLPYVSAYGGVEYRGTGTLNVQVGLFGSSNNYNNGNVTNSAGIVSGNDNGLGGTMTNVFAFLGDIANSGQGSGGTVTNGYILACGVNGLGEIVATNKYGVYINIDGSKNLLHELQIAKANKIKFNDLDNSNYVSLSSPSVVSSNIDFKLPSADGLARQAIVTDASGNLSFGFPVVQSRSYEFIMDDFNGGNITSVWLNTISSGILTQATATTVPSFSGICQFSTGTSATGRARLSQGTTTTIFGTGTRTYTFETKIRIPVLSTATQRYLIIAGFNNLATGLGTDRLCFTYSDVTSPNWMMSSSKAGVASIVNTGIAVAINTDYKLKVVVNASATTATYYINDVQVGTASATNIPLVATQTDISLIKSVGTTASLMYCDWKSLTVEYSSAR